MTVPLATRRTATPTFAVLVLGILIALLIPSLSAVAAASPRHEPATTQRYSLPSGSDRAAPTRADLTNSGTLVRDFAAPTVRWGAGHRGIDLRVAADTEVFAPQAGTVTFVGVVVDRPIVVISHPDGLRSTLEPVVSELGIGSTVARGSAVGVLSAEVATHCAPVSCLHWGVRRGDDYVDPLQLVVETEAIVLLPLQAR